MKMKTIINKWDLIKCKSFCTAKKTINTGKGNTQDGKKIFVNESKGKRLITEIHKQHVELNIKKTNNPIKKWAQDISPKKVCRWPRGKEKMLNITNYQRNAYQNCNDHHPKFTLELLLVLYILWVLANVSRLL